MTGSTAWAPRSDLLGILYAEDFDDEGVALPAVSDPAPAAEPDPVEPLFTAAELDAARAEGQRAGQAAMEGSLLAGRNQLLGALAQGFAEARAGASEAALAAAEGVARCILTALAACLPTLCQRHGAAELRVLIGALLPALPHEPKVVVRAHPQTVTALKAELAEMDPDDAGRVEMVPSETLPPGDARITWADGSAVRGAARTRAALEEGLAALGLLETEHAHA